MSTGSQQQQQSLYYEQDRAVKNASSEPPSPHDIYGTASGATSTSTPAKRGVRHLTDAQLAKKRANDRESQRAIRERTKKQIETLESRVKELESGEAYQRLHAIVKEKEVLQVENEEIRSRLASVLSILQPIVDTRAGQLNTGGIHAPESDSTSQISRPSFGSSLPVSSVDPTHRHDYEDVRSVFDPRLVEPSNVSRAESSSFRESPASPYYVPPMHSYPHAGGTSRLNHLYREDYTNNASEKLRPLYRSQHSQHQTTSVPSSPLPWPFPMTPQERPGTAMGTHHETHASGEQSPEEPPPRHTQHPNNIRPTCHFDSIIWNFTQEARARLAEGKSVDEVLGASDPDLTCFIEPHRSPNSQLITTLLIDILKTYSSLNELPEKICVLMNMFVYLRWFILSTPENYNAMPEHLRPVDTQVRVAHPIWVDMLPWPTMRAKMCFCYPSLPLDNFFIPFTATLSVHWPGDGDTRSCLQRGDDGRMHMSSSLRRHWWDLKPYSLGLMFAQRIPMLADTCRIVDDDGHDVRT